MWSRAAVGVLFLTIAFLDVDFAQVPANVDFRRDVQPILRQNCYGCHGPTQQRNGFRLDRRRDAMRGGTIPVIGPGNSEGSRLYQRLTGDRYGTRMPPTGPLAPEQIAIIKAWIDQGAEWPDDASGETPAPPMDPKAARLMDAALHRDDAAVSALLGEGVSPNVTNDAGATPLMWAIEDLRIVRLLLDAGANVNAKSDDGRTPLLIAAGIPGTAPVVQMLIERGADVNVKAPRLFGMTTPLTEAAYAGDEAVFRLLLDHHGDIRAAGPVALLFGFRSQCTLCIDTLLQGLAPEALTAAAVAGGPPTGPALAIPPLVQRGADINAKDADGRTLLMLAAASDAIPTEVVKLLLARGADVNAIDNKGESALHLARLRGDTPVVALLVAAGAKDDGPGPIASVKPAPAASLRAAVERSLPLLQRTDDTFLKKSGCVSCHNNTMTAMTVATLRARGFVVDERIAQQQLQTIAAYLDSWRERALQDVPIPGDQDTVSSILLGMAAEKYPANAATDAMATLIKREQAPDGHWRIFAHRPPLEYDDIQVTAASMHALQAYAPQRERAEFQKSIDKAADWLEQATPHTMDGRTFQVLGLGWAGRSRDVIRRAGRALIAEQRPDGGWAQMPSLRSDAYATGEALVALTESGAIQTSDIAYKRGVAFLLKTQAADGSWFVRTRALPIQPYFDAGFPYGVDQFISAAATNWATRALALAYVKPS